MTEYRHLHSGKVRDLYEAPDGLLLMVASDRISAYDFVLPTPIPDKGRILTQLSLWWFERLADIVPHHVVSTDVPPEYAGRALLCRRLTMYPVECVARGYLAGSGLAEYLAAGTVCGVPLPAGLVDGSALPEPVFTPATKAAMGEHDENVTFEQVAVDRRRRRGGGAARHDPRGLPPGPGHRGRARHRRGRHQARAGPGRRGSAGAG